MPAVPETSFKKPHILLSGFGPFGNHSINPSWSIVNAFLRIPEAKITKLHLRTCYADVSAIVPPLLASGQFDAVIHLGVGYPGAVRLEEFGYGDGFVKVDVDGRLPEGDVFEGEEKTKRTTLDLQALKAGLEGVEISNDPGRFLCDFVYFTSLAQSNSRYPVLFIHVPPVGEPYSLEEMTSMIEKLVTRIVQTIS